jgi:hypothetical protein
MLDRAGNLTSEAHDDPGAELVYYEPATGHNIPAVFWNFLNVRGLIWDVNHQRFVDDALLSDPWWFTSGLPITEPYWAHAKIAGGDRIVLIQVFQRRVLTYIPTNPAGWQVQMGNVGQHYYDWRYHDAGR